MLSLRDLPEVELGEIPLPVVYSSDPVPPPPPPPPPPPSNDDPIGRRR